MTALIVPVHAIQRFAVLGILFAALATNAPASQGQAQDQDPAQDPSQSQAPAQTSAPPPQGAGAGRATPASQSSPLPARLSDVEGSVRLAQIAAPAEPSQAPAAGQLPPPPPADETFDQASVNMPVLAGMQIETGDDGRAEVEFNDGSIARLTPNSAVAIVSLESAGEGLRAVRGLSYYELPAGSPGVLTLEAGPDQARLAPNTLLRADLDNPPFQVAVLRGSAHFNNKSSDIGFEANAGETASLDPSSPTAYDLKQDVAENTWDAWNGDRDSALAQMADGETNARVGNGSSDSAAWNDLDYYGTWYNVPGAGMAWAPDGVDASFDPYGAGAWGLYSGVGYTWVSSYPWGWLPYHCGGWSYFNNFGWGWQPGRGCGGFGGVGWYPYTGLHHAPNGYRIPPRPVPLDPRLRNHLGGVPLPRSQPLKPVLRGPEYRFRTVGGTRPEPRAFPLGKVASANGGAGTESAGDGGLGFAPTLPVVNGQQYRQPGGYGFAGGAGGGGAYGARGYGGGAYGAGGLQSQHIERGRVVVTPSTGPIAPLPRVVAPAPRIAPPPRVIAAPPRVVMPAPAPHFSAPAPAARPH